jgi:hypothetical protein
MATEDADDLVAFQDVRVIRATASTLLCLIKGKSVWLPRGHISGKLWSAGDRGRLFVRRWVARDRQLIDLDRETITSLEPSSSRLSAELHLVQRDAGEYHAK